MIICEGFELLNKYEEEANFYERKYERVFKEHIEEARDNIDNLDIEFLKLTNKNKIMTSIQLSKITSTPIPTANKRLKKLYKLGCIDRFWPRAPKGKGSMPTHVVLGPVGAKILNIKGFRRVKVLPKNWRHTVMVNEIYSNLAVSMQVFSWNKEVKCLWEDKLTKEKYLIADAFIGYRNKGGNERWAMIEADRGTEHRDVLSKKLNNYIEYFNTIDFQRANWQPYSDIAIIPEVFFIMKYKEDAIWLKKKINKIDSNVSFKVNTLENIKVKS